MMDRKEKKRREQFWQAILSLRDAKECEHFFEDVCTIKELQDMTNRLEVARLLSEGKVFSEINRTTGASSATISRVNKCLVYGPGGYRAVLNHLGASDAGEDKKR